MPESTHMQLWVMSDRAIPRSFRFMEGFGVHTFRFVNAEGRSTYVKFHWKPLAGMQSVLWDEAVKINGADPDFHRRDLWDAITAADPPQWELGLQLFDDDFADAFDFDVLDPTKLIPEEVLPVRRVGRLVLDKTVDNFFAETEQIAFCTQNIVPGIDFTNDPLLQGRNFSYLDTQTKRLGGPNFTQLPINAPNCPVVHFQQDGHMAFRNPAGRVNYEPNSWPPDIGGPREDPQGGFTTFPTTETGPKRRIRPESFADHHSQAHQFWISQTAVEQSHIVAAFVFELSKVERPDIRRRVVANLRNVDEGLAAAIAAGLGLAEMPEAPEPAVTPRRDLDPSPALSIIGNGPLSFAGRKVGVLVTSGADAKVVASLRDAITGEGALVELVTPTIEGVTADDGSVLAGDQTIDGGPSVLYDAVAVVPAAASADTLAAHPAARQFVEDAWRHLKVIGVVPAARPLLESAGIAETGAGLVALDDAGPVGFVEACRALRVWDRFEAVVLS
jgi:catalase